MHIYGPLVLIKWVTYRGCPDLLTLERGLCSQPPPTQLPQCIKADKAHLEQKKNKKRDGFSFKSSLLQDAVDVKHPQGFKGRQDKINSCLSQKHHLAWKIIQAGKGWRLPEDSKGCAAQACPALPPLHASALTRAGEKTTSLDLPQYG